MRVHLFLGPTMPWAGALDILPQAVPHPPVAHGDLLRLNCARGDVVVLVDGYYHHSASVRHKEVLALLSEGVLVVGCASMGALRAAELHPHGMVGHGVVFELYRDGVLDADDEVAVLHGEAPEYRKLSVPLVTIRYAVEAARAAKALTDTEAHAIIEAAQSCHYTERTWQRLQALTHPDDANNPIARLREFGVAHPRTADIKLADTVDTLAKLARGEIAPTGEPPEWSRSAKWRNRFLDDWRTEFSVTEIDGTEVSRGDVVRYGQIYSAGFPARWRRFALGRIAEFETDDEDDLARRALAVAARFALTPASLSDAQAGLWLTAAERADLPGAEALLRVLVRSWRPSSPTHDFAVAEPQLADDPQARRAVAESQVINAEVASWSGSRSAGHLKQAVLTQCLAGVWGVAEQDEFALLTAARDRGFRSLEDAAEAVRPFFLRGRFRSIGTSRAAAGAN